MSITEDSVLFAVCDVDVHSHDVGPFFYINQFNHVKRIIRIPIQHFITVVKTEGPEHVPEEDLKLVFLSNVGRCGSTVLTQVFEKLPHTVSISEPECLMPFAADPDLFSTKKVEDQQQRGFTRQEALEACIVALVASSNAGGETKTNIVIKPKAHAIAVTTEIDEIFRGRVKHLYLYRHPAQYVTSVTTVFNSLLHPVVRSAVVRFSIKMGMENFLMTHFPDRSSRRAQSMRSLMDKVDLTKNSYRFAALFCANILSLVEHCETGGLDFKFVSYHELIKDTDSVMAEVSRYCGMEGRLEGEERLALPEGDSQGNSGLSRQHLNNYKKSLDDNKIREIDHVLQAFKLPTCETFPIDSRSFEKMLENV